MSEKMKTTLGISIFISVAFTFNKDPMGDHYMYIASNNILLYKYPINNNIHIRRGFFIYHLLNIA